MNNSRKSILRYPYRIITGLILLILLIPILMALIWFIRPSHPLNVLIMDKTVLDKTYREHAGISWTLRHEKIIRPDGSPYRRERDYMGFFPKENRRYHIQDVQGYTMAQLDSLSDTLDVLYLAEMYGVYEEDWYRYFALYPRLLYGGTVRNEVILMDMMSLKGKTIIGEFNMLGPPTDWTIRKQIESTLGLRWTGWTGRYFATLDTLQNTAIPRWVVHQYKKQHNNSYPFTQSGIVLIHENQSLVILESGTHLRHPWPVMVTPDPTARRFSITAAVDYHSWFNIVEIDDPNQSLSAFHLQTTDQGDSVLAEDDLPHTFPAIVAHESPDYHFYYFGGDFAEMSISRTSACFSGIQWIYTIFPANANREFFWQVTYPLLRQIFRETIERTENTSTE